MFGHQTVLKALKRFVAAFKPIKKGKEIILTGYLPMISRKETTKLNLTMNHFTRHDGSARAIRPA